MTPAPTSKFYSATCILGHKAILWVGAFYILRQPITFYMSSMLFSLQCSKDQNVHIYFGCQWCGAYDLCPLTNDTNAYWIQCDAIGKHVQQHARLCDMIHRIHIYANWTKQISGQDERDAHTKNILYSMRIPWEGGEGEQTCSSDEFRA